jgi:hypothetical protein
VLLFTRCPESARNPLTASPVVPLPLRACAVLERFWSVTPRQPAARAALTHPPSRTWLSRSCPLVSHATASFQPFQENGASLAWIFKSIICSQEFEGKERPQKGDMIGNQKNC